MLQTLSVKNDDFGHSAGDRLLRDVAMIIKRDIRSIDTVARLGGDEFALLFPETGFEGASTALVKINNRLRDFSKKNSFSITFSIGVAVCEQPICEVDELINKADNLMYEVKKAGGNDVKYAVVNKTSLRVPQPARVL